MKIIQKGEYCELIEDYDAKIIESCELIDKKFTKNGLKQEEIKNLNSIIIEYEKNGDIDMSRLLTDELKKLNPLKKELRVIARDRGAKNYKNLSKSELIREINKLKPKNHKKIVSSLLFRREKNIGFKPKEKVNKKEVLKLSLKKK